MIQSVARALPPQEFYYKSAIRLRHEAKESADGKRSFVQDVVFIFGRAACMGLIVD